MTITKEMRLAAFSQLPESYASMYSSEESGELFLSLIKKYSVSDKYALINVVGDIILGFYPISDLKKLMVENVKVSSDEADKIASDLKEFLEPIEGRANTSSAVKQTFEISDSKERLDLRPEGVQKQNSVSPEVGIVEEMARPLTREELMNALSPKRTMASDIEAARIKADAAKNEGKE